MWSALLGLVDRWRVGRPADPELVRARLLAIAGLAPEAGPAGPTSGDPPGPPVPSGLPAAREPTVPALRALVALGVGAVLLAGLFVWRSQGGELATVTVAAGTVVGEPSASPSTSAAAVLVVQVVGEVRRPGVVRLPAGARVVDALVAAGGLRKGGSTGLLNLARRLSDGEQVVVGADQVDASAPPAAGGGAGATLDLNSADAATLDSLPGVGPVTAAAILTWRDEHGGFTSVEQLREVSGIGPKTYEKLAPLVTVGPGP